MNGPTTRGRGRVLLSTARALGVFSTWAFYGMWLAVFHLGLVPQTLGGFVALGVTLEAFPSLAKWVPVFRLLLGHHSSEEVGSARRTVRRPGR